MKNVMRLLLIVLFAFWIVGCGCLTNSRRGAGRQGGASEIEPNDTPRLADRVDGLVIHGIIDRPGDVDWFILAGQEGYNPTFSIFHDNANDFDFIVIDVPRKGEGNVTIAGRAIGTQSGDTITVRVPHAVAIKVYSARGTGSYRISISP